MLGGAERLTCEGGNGFSIVGRLSVLAHPLHMAVWEGVGSRVVLPGLRSLPSHQPPSTN